MKRPAIRRNIREVANAKRNRRRDELIGIVKHGLDITGTALTELRDDQHWKDTHNSFADFCRDTFTISKTKLYVIIRTMEVGAKLPKRLQSKITNESQALALLKIPEDKWEEAIEKAEKNGGITADNLLLHAAKPAQKTITTETPQECGNQHSTKSASTESKASSKQKSEAKSTLPKKPPVALDEVDTPIPLDALPFWEKSWDEKDHKDDVKVQDILSEISHLKSIVVGGREKGEKRWLKVTNSIADTFDSLRSLISEAKPYAVCTTCMGSPSLQPEGCNFCRSTGLISKWQWDTQSREEVKKIRLLSNADLKSKREAENVH